MNKELHYWEQGFLRSLLLNTKRENGYPTVDFIYGIEYRDSEDGSVRDQLWFKTEVEAKAALAKLWGAGHMRYELASQSFYTDYVLVDEVI